MTKVPVVLAHPNPGSLNAATAEAVGGALGTAGAAAGERHAEGR